MVKRLLPLIALIASVVVGVIAVLATTSASGQSSGSGEIQGESPAQGAAEQNEGAAENSSKAGGEDRIVGEADVVKVGALINDIQQLDLASHSYNVDAYIWFKWTNPDIDPSRSFEFMNAFELWGHILSYESKEPEVLPDGTLYQVTRIQGKFNTKLPLEEYPYDTQVLQVEMEDSNLDSSALVYEPDDDPASMSEGLTIPGWSVEEPTLEIVDNTYDTDFGDPRVEGDSTFSRAKFQLAVTRPKGTYSFKLILPLLLVALTAALSLLVHPQFVEGRIGIGITALLTLVALQITSNSNLPEVDYLILLDKLYVLSYAFVVLTMAVIVKNSWVDAEGDVATATKADRRGLFWLMGGYAIGVVLIFVLTLG